MPETTPKLGLKTPLGNESVSREAYNENLRLMDQNAASQAEVTAHTTKALLDHPDGSVSDVKIGNRTILDTMAPAGNSGPVTPLLSGLAYMVKAITGKSNWWTAPALNMETVRTKLDETASQASLNNHKNAISLDHPDNSVSDAKLGNRTVVDGVAPNGNSGTVTTILGWFAYMFKTITGEIDWKTPPVLNLKTAKTKITESAPPGQISYFARSTAPPGWLKANGALVSRNVYADLFDAIGTTFGAGDGSTTFNLPDLRGEFIRVWDDGRGVDPGRVLGNWQPDELRKHKHGIPETGPNDSGDGPGFDSGTTPQAIVNYTEEFGDSETRPRNVALLACIKY